MSISTDGILCYGILCEEYSKFPWDEHVDNGDVLYGDIEDWWLVEQGFEEKENEDYSNTYDRKQKFLEEYPLPVEIVNVCHIDNPIYILAVPSTVKRAYRGDSEKLPSIHVYKSLSSVYINMSSEESGNEDQCSLSVSFSKIDKLREFCEKYNIKYKEENEGWWLGSYTDF